MAEHLVRPPPPGVPFTAGSLPAVPLARALGLCSLFGSCGAEHEMHRASHHSGKDWILLATIGGGGTIRTGGSTYDAAPTTLLVVPPGTTFHEAAWGGAAWSWICLRLGFAAESPLFGPPLPAPQLCRPDLACFQRMSEIVTHLHQQPPGLEWRVVGLLTELCGEILMTIANGDQPAPSPFLQRAQESMAQDLGRNWSVAELAALCDMSPSSFAHRFKAEAGVAPKQWLVAARMREARRLLADQRPVAEVAVQLGYSSRYHFSQAFKQIEGMPPGRFQRLATRR